MSPLLPVTDNEMLRYWDNEIFRYLGFGILKYGNWDTGAGCIENVGNAIYFWLFHVIDVYFKYQNLETLGIGDVILMLRLGYFDNWLLRHWDIVTFGYCDFGHWDCDIERILRNWKFVTCRSFVNVSWMYIWYIKILRQCVYEMAFWDWDIVQGFHLGGHPTESPPLWTRPHPSSNFSSCAGI